VIRLNTLDKKAIAFAIRKLNKRSRRLPYTVSWFSYFRFFLILFLTYFATKRSRWYM